MVVYICGGVADIYGCPRASLGERRGGGQTPWVAFALLLTYVYNTFNDHLFTSSCGVIGGEQKFKGEVTNQKLTPERSCDQTPSKVFKEVVSVLSALLKSELKLL
jgi:hypothetical protein